MVSFAYEYTATTVDCKLVRLKKCPSKQWSYLFCRGIVGWHCLWQHDASKHSRVLETKSRTGYPIYAYLKSGFGISFWISCESSFKSIYLHFSSISWHLKTSKGTLSRYCTVAINPGRTGKLLLTVWNNFFHLWKNSGFLSPLKSLQWLPQMLSE